jgi:hypothetical protein
MYKNVETRNVQRTGPTLLDFPNNGEALDFSDVVEEDEPDSEGAERRVAVSKALLPELVGAACDVPVR